MKHKLPLNRIQQKFWADCLLKDNDIDYNDPNATFVVEGELDLTALKEAYRLVMKEYPPLMSTIGVIDGQPYFICDEKNFHLPFETVGMTTSAKEEEVFVSKGIEERTCLPFHLEYEYPCRFVAFIGQRRTYLYHLFHHVVMDGRTLFVFFSRVSEIYSQLKHNSYKKKSQVADLLAYNELLNREYLLKREENIRFWKQYMGDIPLCLPLPMTGKKDEESLESASAVSGLGQKRFMVDFELGKQTYMDVKTFCRKMHTTPFRFFSAVWAVTLSKICGSDRLLLDHALNLCPEAFSHLFGVFINNLPLRYNFSDPDITFIQFLDEANSHRQTERDKTCIFYHDLVQHEGLNIGINYPLRLTSLTMPLEGCDSSLFSHVHVPMSQDLVLSIEDNESCDCVIFFNSDIDKAYPHALAHAFKNILLQVLLHPEAPIGNLESLTQEEVEQRIMAESLSLQKAASPDVFLNDFSECVRQYGNHVAVEIGDEQVSYQHLDKLSNRIALYLMEQGYERKRIGLANNKTKFTIAAILGIMKSRNTYVPIDVNMPEERQALIVKDSDVSMVIDQELLSGFQVSSEAYTAPILPKVIPSDEAYIIYTSGSTGHPKGTPILHSMLNQTIQTNISIQQLSHLTRSTQFANLSFDASIVEIFPTLCVGGTIFVVDDETRKDARLFLQFLEQKQITESNIPPVILSSLPQSRLPHLKTIIFGGDKITASAAAYWSQHHRLINAYGPTENTVDATYSILTADSLPNDIGTSMDGVMSFVMDSHHRLVPDGIVGELCIGGVKLTEGYLNNKELNGQVFIDNPYTMSYCTDSSHAHRLYKTGDMVKRDQKGHILFVGRKDFQVKVNGHRIETLEIENAISAFRPSGGGPKLTDCVVAVNDNGHIKQLHAYIETADAKSFPEPELVAWLKGRLPHYMIPSAIIKLQEFPRTQSGKIDRKRLPQPVFIRSEEGYCPPVTITEKRLAKIWTAILGTPFISRNDGFLSLNGDSMAVIRLTFQVQAAFGVNIKASQVYDNPELKSLGKLIDDTLASSSIEDQLMDCLTHCFHSGDLTVDTDIATLGDSRLTENFVWMAADRYQLFMTCMDVRRYHTVRQLATNVDFSMVFWTEGKKTDKPILVFFGGFVEYYPYHEAVVSCLEKHFSVLMVESYCQFFQNEKNIDIQQLWNAYHDLFTVALRSEQVSVVSGYCTGAEIALAFAQYFHNRHPELPPYRVLNMEGVFNRGDGVYDLHNDAMADRINISNILYSQFPSYDYCGDMMIVMAGRPSNILDPEQGEVTDEKVLKTLRDKWESNIDDWRNHFPHSPFYLLDCMHMTFPEKKNLEALLQILNDYY